MTIRFALAACAALALSACSGGDKPVDEGSASASAAPEASSAAPASSAAAAAAAPAKGGKPTKEFVVGKWGTDGDCTLAMDLKVDGTSDGPFGNWSYADGVITFADAPEMKINVTVIDEKTMESRNSASSDGNKTAKMTRCP